MYLGDFPTGFTTVVVPFTTSNPDGSPVAPSSAFEAADVAIYKDGTATPRSSTSGWTMNSPQNSKTGFHLMTVDLSDNTDSGFYAAGHVYTVVLDPSDETVASVSVRRVLGLFTIGIGLSPTTAGRTLDVTTTGGAGIDWANVENPTTTLNLSGTSTKALEPTTAGRMLDVSSGGEAGIDWANIGSPTTTVNLSGTSTKALEPTTSGRTLDVTATGEAGIDWANIGGPTTTQNLSGTTIKTATDVESDTADIQTRLPAALASGRMDSSVGAYQSGLTPLQPTVAGRTLDVTATGAGGVDWGNVENQGTTVGLSGTTVKTATDVETVTDKLDTALELDGGVYRYTTNALEQAPTGGSAPSAADVADAVWDEARAGHTTAGTFGQGVASVQGNVTGSVASVSGNVSGSVGSVAGDVVGDVQGSVDSVTQKVTPIDVDGLTHDQAMTLLLSVLGGVAVPSGSTVTFNRRDGSTGYITITYGATDGERTASTIL